MSKILSCPNCGNSANLTNNHNTTICGACGYSWVNVSNRNIKASEIKVVMDSLNHYNYTLNNYNDDDTTFPFYAIDNQFIESKDSNKNRLIKVNTANENDIKQNYLGINKLKPSSKRPVMSYDDGVDLPNYQHDKIISDRSNQEYEIHRDKNIHENSFRNQQINKYFDNNRKNMNHQREVFNNTREQNIFSERNDADSRIQKPSDYIHPQHISFSDKQINEFAGKDPEGFSQEYKITKQYNDGSVEIQQREKEQSYNFNEDNTNEFFSNNDLSENFNKEEYVRPSLSQDHRENREKRENRETREHKDHRENRIKKERFSYEQKDYKEKLKQRLENPENLDNISSSHLTYEKYQETVSNNLENVRKEQINRNERIKNKQYIRGTNINKYKRFEEPKYSKKNKERIRKENRLSANYIHDNDDIIENIAPSGGNIFNKLKKELLTTHARYISPFEEKIYNKKFREPKAYQKPENTPSTLEGMVALGMNMDEKLLEGELKKGTFGKNPRLSFFENLQINNDGTIKEDPLGLNQDYNDFFNRTYQNTNLKKYSFSQIITAIKKTINTDKLSFKMVIIITIFILLATVSHFVNSPSFNRKDKNISELDIGKDFAQQIPVIKDSSDDNAVLGDADALVMSKGRNKIDPNNIVNANYSEQKKEVLVQQNKKSVASDLSLEELRNNTLADLELKNPVNKTKKSNSIIDKTSMYLQEKISNFFNDINLSVSSNKWQIEGTNKYFEINMVAINKSASKAYIIKTIEITLLDISGNILAKREIYPNKVIEKRERANLTIRIPKAPDLSADSYVFVKNVIVKE